LICIITALEHTHTRLYVPVITHTCVIKLKLPLGLNHLNGGFVRGRLEFVLFNEWPLDLWGFQPCGRSAMTNTHTQLLQCENPHSHLSRAQGINFARRPYALSRKCITYICIHTHTHSPKYLRENPLSALALACGVET
jgi:hypothetical protein